MVLREALEKREEEILSPLATKAAQSRGRLVEEEKCPIRTDFQRDRDRIIHSKAFRRLMHKTQVFLAPEGDHYRTRLTHTLEVSQISRTVARCLNLNEDLTEAIALGHDLGHTPFGHSGEEVLDRLLKDKGFRHNEQSLRVVDYLESRSNGEGLNLTYEVRNGILCHSGKLKADSLEGRIVNICDRVAYINHDIDDAIRSGVITLEDLPKSALETFGYTHKERINTMVTMLVENSYNRDDISMKEEYLNELLNLRSFMFDRVYKSSDVKKNEDLNKVREVIEGLYAYYLQYPEKLPKDHRNRIEEFGKEEVVKDYIAGMTDRFALNSYEKIKK